MSFRIDLARLVRYGGLAGSLLLAIVGRLGGVQPRGHFGVAPARFFAGGYGLIEPVCWVLGIGLLAGAWLLGRNVVPSTRWAYVTVALWALPMLLPAILGSRDIYSYACQGWAAANGHDPYAAGPRGAGCPWQLSTAPRWRNSPAPYGPAFLVLAAGAVRLGGSLLASLMWLRMVAVGGVLLTAVSLPTLARRAGVEPRTAVWLALGSPLIAVHLISGGHNDALMVGLLAAGLAVVAAAARRPDAVEPPAAAGHRVATYAGLPITTWVRFAAGGGLLGLAVAVKATAAVAIPFAALVAVGRPYRLRWLISRGGAVVFGSLVALAGVSLASGLGLGWVRGLIDGEKSVLWTSMPTGVGLAVGTAGRLVGLHLPGVAVFRTAGLVVLGCVLIGLWWWSRSGDPLLGAGLALAATVALAPVIQPWYLTWPLVVLAAVWSRARSAWWLLAPCTVANFVVLPDGTNLDAATRLPGSFLMTGLAVLLAVRGVRRLRSRKVDTGVLADTPT
jgi:alpha-1,6-mannosyltransferase